MMDVSKLSSHLADVFKSGMLDGMSSIEIAEVIKKATLADDMQKVVWNPNSHFTNQDQIDSYRKYIEGDMPYFMYSNGSVGSGGGIPADFKLIPTDERHKERWGCNTTLQGNMAIIKDGWLYTISSTTFFLEKPELIINGSENIPECLDKLKASRNPACKWDYAARMPLNHLHAQADSDVSLQKLTQEVIGLRTVIEQQQAHIQMLFDQCPIQTMMTQSIPAAPSVDKLKHKKKKKLVKPPKRTVVASDSSDGDSDSDSSTGDE